MVTCQPRSTNNNNNNNNNNNCVAAFRCGLRAQPSPLTIRRRAGAAGPADERASEHSERWARMTQHEERKVLYFGAGPARLPLAVLSRAQEDMIDWQGCGLSVMEMSHRDKEYDSIHSKCLADVRELLHVPDNYAVLLMQGGGTGQFSAVPLNLMDWTKERPKADYIVTGSWSAKAAEEAGKYGEVHYVCGKTTAGIPPKTAWQFSPDASYVYLCGNETVHGVEFHDFPDTGSIPLVADMSSTLMSRPLDVRRFGLIYAGAQKNMGPSGVTLVIVRKDLLGKAHKLTPSVLDYQVTVKENSLVNTPPCYIIYTVGLVLQWVKEQGGLEEMARRSQAKSASIYDVIDRSGGFYHSPVAVESRSWMNIPFRVGGQQPDGKWGSDSVEKAFLSEARDKGMAGLKGHRSVGGIRVSLYNATLPADAQRLAAFMLEFQRAHSS